MIGSLRSDSKLVRGARVLLRPRVRYALSWLLLLGALGSAGYLAWTTFDDRDRRDGNSGHATIDFGGQYLMGRMLLEGRGLELFHRQAQREQLTRVYPDEDGQPGARTDVENMMGWLVGEDDPHAGETIGAVVLPLGAGAWPGPVAAFAAQREFLEPRAAFGAAAVVVRLSADSALSAAVTAVAAARSWKGDRVERLATPWLGGPLYPPIDGLLYAPLAILPVRPAYRISQAVGLLLGLLAAVGICRFCQGRVWWTVAATVVLGYPHLCGGVELGQNAPLTLAILVWGWVLVVADRPWLAGLLWGLLAYKPVWWLCFFAVPLLTRRWRVCAGMCATAAALVLLSLPFVGLGSWADWPHVGALAMPIYRYDRNWVELSRDLLSVPRRWTDWHQPWMARRDSMAMAVTGLCLYLPPLAVTLAVSLWRNRRVSRSVGHGPAFLLLGAWLACPHFMYYDTALTALPMALLFTNPAVYLSPKLVAIRRLRNRDVADALRPSLDGVGNPELPRWKVRLRDVWLVNRFEPTVLVLLLLNVLLFPALSLGLRALPYDTFFLLALWAWCGWLVVRPKRRAWPRRGHGDQPSTDLSVVGDAAKFAELSADVRGAHERFANEHSVDAGLG